MTEFFFEGRRSNKKTRVRVIQGDITDQITDAIVNPANSSLMGGGGADGAIHRRGGPSILAECNRIRASEWPGGLPTGKAVITGGGNLKARYVIHTVGPVWNGGRSSESKLLADCHKNSLSLATSRGLRSIAFPAISTGAFGFPVELASKVALESVKDFLDSEDEPLIEEIVFVLFTAHDLGVYEEAARLIFGTRRPREHL